MFYFFERDTEYVRCELRTTTGARTVQIVIGEPGLPERVETYATWEDASERWEALKRNFQHDGWKGPLGRE
jgi:hypothetical protein